jgi:hypothetical protein
MCSIGLSLASMRATSSASCSAMGGYMRASSSASLSRSASAFSYATSHRVLLGREQLLAALQQPRHCGGQTVAGGILHLAARLRDLPGRQPRVECSRACLLGRFVTDRDAALASLARAATWSEVTLL